MNAKKIHINIDDQIKFYDLKIAELKKQDADEKDEKLRDELELLNKVSAMGYVVSRKDGLVVEELQIDEAAADEKHWYTAPVKEATKAVIDTIDRTYESLENLTVTSKSGMWAMVSLLALLILGSAWYPVFFKLNDSELRIMNASGLHFISHVWMGLAVLLLGFGFQYLAFNAHFRYLWTNIDTESSATGDFAKPNAAGNTRLLAALFTWAFPVYVLTHIFQFILG